MQQDTSCWDIALLWQAKENLAQFMPKIRDVF